MKTVFRFSVLALVLGLVAGAAVVTPPAADACVWSYYSYMEGQCLVTEIYSSCSSCYDVQIECPWGDSEDHICS